MADFKNVNITKDEDINIDSHNANAIGAGSVAGSGFANVVGATGAHSVAAQGSTVNQADHGSQVLDNSLVGQNQFNSPNAIQAGGDVHGANTGVNTGIISGGDTSHAVVGNFNHVTDISGSADGSAFGAGASAASGNNVHDGAVSAGGNASNVSHVLADHGAAVGAHDAFGTNVEHTETNVLGSDNTNIAADHSASFADQHQQTVHNAIHDSLIGGDVHGGDAFDV